MCVLRSRLLSQCQDFSEKERIKTPLFRGNDRSQTMGALQHHCSGESIPSAEKLVLFVFSFATIMSSWKLVM